MKLLQVGQEFRVVPHTADEEALLAEFAGVSVRVSREDAISTSREQLVDQSPTRGFGDE